MTYTALAYEQAFNPHTVTAYANNVRLARDLPWDALVTDEMLVEALSGETEKAHAVAVAGGLAVSPTGSYAALVWINVLG